MATQTFGAMLFFPESDLEEFPSPESLKGKILISTKLPKQYLVSQVGNSAEEKVGTSEKVHVHIVLCMLLWLVHLICLLSCMLSDSRINQLRGLTKRIKMWGFLTIGV